MCIVAGGESATPSTITEYASDSVPITIPGSVSTRTRAAVRQIRGKLLADSTPRTQSTPCKPFPSSLSATFVLSVVKICSSEDDRDEPTDHRHLLCIAH
jgi:hypothetical protein